MYVTKHDIEQGLRNVGIERGDMVLVHSSLRSMDTVTGGAESVIDAFLGVIGDTGTLVMPAFSFIWDKTEEKMIVPPFDPHSSPMPSLPKSMSCSGT